MRVVDVTFFLSRNYAVFCLLLTARWPWLFVKMRGFFVAPSALSNEIVIFGPSDKQKTIPRESGEGDYRYVS